jgi:hypothetical protein
MANLRHVRDHSLGGGLDQHINRQRVNVLSRGRLVRVIDQVVTVHDDLDTLIDTVELFACSLDFVHHSQLPACQLPHFVIPEAGLDFQMRVSYKIECFEPQIKGNVFVAGVFRIKLVINLFAQLLL